MLSTCHIHFGYLADDLAAANHSSYKMLIESPFHLKKYISQIEITTLVSTPFASFNTDQCIII